MKSYINKLLELKRQRILGSLKEGKTTKMKEKEENEALEKH